MNSIDFCFTVIMVVAELQYIMVLKNCLMSLEKNYIVYILIELLMLLIDLYQKFVIQSSSYHFSNSK